MAIANAITVSTSNLPAKAIAVIRKATGLSISDIKNHAQTGDYLIERGLSDDKSLLAMIRLAEDLESLGVETEFYQGGMKKSLDFMKKVYAATKRRRVKWVSTIAERIGLVASATITTTTPDVHFGWMLN